MKSVTTRCSGCWPLFMLLVLAKHALLGSLGAAILTKPPFITRWHRACLGTLLLVAAAWCAAAASPKRVLIPDPFERDIAPLVLGDAAPVCDWRELGRWGIEVARLPAGSVIRFRQPGFWKQSQWLVAGTVLFCLLQTVLIIQLLANRAKRRQGEAEAALIADISSKFVNLPASEVDREIMGAERRICEFLDLDIAAIWQWSYGSPGSFMLTHFYSVQDGPQPSTRLNQEDFPWFRQLMLQGRIVPISSLDDMPAEATLDRENARRLGIKSNLCIPLMVGGQPVGILGLNTTRAERKWPDPLVKRMQLVAQIFTNALARKQADQALRSAEMEARELRGNLAHAGRVTLLGQLASALAHELSQPLGAILRNAEAAEIMLQASAPNLEELRAIVKDILSDDARAGQVIDRLLSLLKRRSVDLQPLDLYGVIAEVLTLVHADAAARHVKIAFSATPGLPTVSGDRVHLQQVMLNLLVNAMDALEGCAPDQRVIQVSALWVDPATVEVRVVDNGPGIPGESLERLFEPFFTTKSTGMGMGLPVSKTIIEAHKGRLWAENNPHGGACFCFTVPVAGDQSSVIGH